MNRLNNNEINAELSSEENGIISEKKILKNEDDYEDDYGEDDYEDNYGYEYTEETAHLRKAPDVIDRELRQDDELFALPKPKTASQIEGKIKVEDKERGLVLTTIRNKKDGYNFNRLYDVSGKKPILIVSGRSLDYKDGMFIVHYPNKQYCSDRGDYLKYMQSVLYKLDKNNKTHFIANNVLKILNDGWFEQSSGVDYSVFLCKNVSAGKYKRIMNFGADQSGHREVSADGTIIDELDRTDWYHRDEYKYNAKNNTLTFVKGKGFQSDIDDYKERNGLTMEEREEDNHETYISPDEEISVYDFINSRDDCEDLVGLGDFYAVKKKGAKQFGIYEISDEDMKNPLIMVDYARLAYSNDEKADNIIYYIGDTTYRCAITQEGNLKLVAKQHNPFDLSLMIGGQWLNIPRKGGTSFKLLHDKGIEIGDYSGRYRNFITVPNDDILKLAHSVLKRGKEVEKSDVKDYEKPKEGYHNTKKRLQKRYEKNNNKDR